MKANNLRKKLHEHRKYPLIALIALFMAVISVSSVTTQANALYILTGIEDTAIILDGTQEVPDLSERMMYVASGSKGYDIRLTAGLPVTIVHGDTVIATRSRSETISTLMSRLGVSLSPLEMVAVDLSDTRMEITIAEEIIYYDEVTEIAPFQTVRIPNPEMQSGIERVVQAGSDGVRSSVYEVIWSSGTQISRQFVEELDTTAVDQIVEYGTGVNTVDRSDRISNIIQNEDGSGILEFVSGATLTFSAAKPMTATAYTSGHGGVGTITATGTVVDVGTVAVDKSVIPLGTRMYIVTDDGIVYGMGVARDTGVRGNIVDLYHETYAECIEFGRRSCTVYILE